MEPCPARFDQLTAEEFLCDIDLVLDATDSMQARLDIDRATYSRRIPWIMGAAVKSRDNGQRLIPSDIMAVITV